MSTNSFLHLSFATILVASSLQTNAFDLNRIKSNLTKWYYGWWLIQPVYEVATAKVDDKECSILQKTQYPEIMVSRKYSAPRWVNWLSNLSTQESGFDYAYDIYQLIEAEMNTLTPLLKKIDTSLLTKKSHDALEKTQQDWRALEQTLIQVFNAKAARNNKAPKGLDMSSAFPEEEKNITKNINSAVDILGALDTALQNLEIDPSRVDTSITHQKAVEPAHQVVTAKKAEIDQQSDALRNAKDKLVQEKNNIMTAVREAKKTIEALHQKQRISSIERLHRKKQADWLQEYITHVCQ